MPYFHKISARVNAERWFRTGDHPGDKPLVNGEGRVVKMYHRDDVHPDLKCSLCGQLMRNHGWIDPPSAPLSLDSQPVDPVTGKQIAAPPPPAPPKYPMTLKLKGKPDVTAANEVEEKEALADGYTHAPVPAAAPPAKPAAKSAVAPIDSKRGDLEGLVICPGDWILTNPNTHEKSTCKDDEFKLNYVKAA